jgi:hypothetical protein
MHKKREDSKRDQIPPWADNATAHAPWNLAYKAITNGMTSKWSALLTSSSPMCPTTTPGPVLDLFISINLAWPLAGAELGLRSWEAKLKEKKIGSVKTIKITKFKSKIN